MANNSFVFVGKIYPCKETNTFKPYQEVWFKNSDWGKKQIKFNMVCGNNRHMMDVSALISKDMDNSTIYTYSKNDGGKAEKYNVPFKKRFDTDVLSKVVEWRKYVIDLNPAFRIEDLTNAIKHFEDGIITDKEMDKLNVRSLDEAKAALSKAKELRQEFISEVDFVDALNELVSDPKIGDMKFKVFGDYELEYGNKDDTWYRKFKPTKVYKVDDDTETSSSGVLHIVYNKDSVDDNDENKIHINGFTPVYLSNYKKNYMSPISVTLDSNFINEKQMACLKRFFTVKQGYKEIGVCVEFLDGAQQIELSVDMLTDEQKDLIECGLLTMDDIKKELGKPVYGDRVTDIIVTNVSRGYSKGGTETAYTSSDFGKPTISVEKPKKRVVIEDEEDDIFADIDEI